MTVPDQQRGIFLADDRLAWPIPVSGVLFVIVCPLLR
jgi:hypothetical protein